MKQTIIYQLKPNFVQEGHLHNLASIATKLYNTDNWIRRQEWEKTGKIPNGFSQIKLLQNNKWYKLLSAQTAQHIIINLQDNYRCWFKLHKIDKRANPPMFRKKDMLSPLEFYQQFKIIDNKIRLALSRKYQEENKIRLIEIEFDKWKEIEGKIKMCQILFRKGKWFAHIVYDMTEPVPKLNEKVMAIDIGMYNLAVTSDTEGQSKIYSGRLINSINYYFNKEKARITSSLTKQNPKRHSSRILRLLQKKQNNQIKQIVHTHSKNIIKDCKRKGITALVVGDLTHITKNKNLGCKGNLKLHTWIYSKLINALEYKSVKEGIRFVMADEAYTSQTCSICGIIDKTSRKHRGLYICNHCNAVLNADVNGSRNILKKYLRDFLLGIRSIGRMTIPSVELIYNVV